ncbi:KPN_02809 family neutral zinc metallopeptidase [Nocardioides dongxiaopingii]|uniref:KPN_02809 family neutral zinc metallopeptidase n=1 Tax=Nocardioides dongxiaopingii TaxID=2576036 RepID=UPI0010C76E69|nr:neutral zinc metallopeptidase [Nocardioides dongxiaopingii]
MRFNPKARLDTGRVSDAGRGGGGGGGGGGSRLPIPGGMAGGGGVIGVIAIVVFVAVQLLGGGGGGGGVSGGGLSAAKFTDTGRYADCKTGEDANNSADCARVAVENSLTDFWGDTLGSDFRAEDRIVTFEGSINTGCGGATSSVGPFYCPGDETIYLDDAFFDDVLVGQLKGPEGAFVEPYVLAHEYGHHVSNLIGTLGKVTGETGPQSTGVRLELQADCFAGMWAKHATETEDSTGNVLLLDLTQDDIATALDAAKTVGDDYIQKRSGGSVDEEVWTHGSSAQRQKWFQVGYTEGTMQACDTFGASRV